jgi:hypothetical protein
MSKTALNVKGLYLNNKINTSILNSINNQYFDSQFHLRYMTPSGVYLEPPTNNYSTRQSLPNYLTNNNSPFTDGLNSSAMYYNIAGKMFSDNKIYQLDINKSYFDNENNIIGRVDNLTIASGYFCLWAFGSYQTNSFDITSTTPETSKSEATFAGYGLTKAPYGTCSADAAYIKGNLVTFTLASGYNAYLFSAGGKVNICNTINTKYCTGVVSSINTDRSLSVQLDDISYMTNLDAGTLEIWQVTDIKPYQVIASGQNLISEYYNLLTAGLYINGGNYFTPFIYKERMYFYDEYLLNTTTYASTVADKVFSMYKKISPISNSLFVHMHLSNNKDTITSKLTPLRITNYLIDLYVNVNGDIVTSDCVQIPIDDFYKVSYVRNTGATGNNVSSLYILGFKE